MLGDITHDLPEKLTSGGSIAWPRSVVLETRRLVANFMEMADSLTAQYARIREMNESLRVEVKEKTEANRRLQAANKELEAFSYSVSHDLKAPLRAISGFAQIIARRHRDALNEEAQHYVDNVVLASERMAVLINELLEYSRIGRIAVRLEPVPLPAVMEQVLDILSQRVSEARADVSVPSPLPAVMGDMGLLRQAFTNLLDNAIKFRGKDTPPEIRVEVRDEGGHVVVLVSDNGIGIAPEYAEKVFTMFQRLHSEDEYPGTGIGLAIVRKAVGLMSGEVWVESRPGRGSTFCVRLRTSGKGADE